MTIPLVCPSITTDGPAAVGETQACNPARGFDFFLFEPLFAVVPLTIEGIVERGINYFKPKISDREKLRMRSTFACGRLKMRGFISLQVESGVKTIAKLVTRNRSRKNPLTSFPIILCLKCLLGK